MHFPKLHLASGKGMPWFICSKWNSEILYPIVTSQDFCFSGERIGKSSLMHSETKPAFGGETGEWEGGSTVCGGLWSMKGNVERKQREGPTQVLHTQILRQLAPRCCPGCSNSLHTRSAVGSQGAASGPQSACPVVTESSVRAERGCWAVRVGEQSLWSRKFLVWNFAPKQGVSRQTCVTSS